MEKGVFFMDLKLQDKVVVVTGGTAGIGFATAQKFVEEGAKVAICGRHQDLLDKALAVLGPRAFGMAADMTVEDDVHGFAKAVHDHFGRIDVWVNNVGASINRKGEWYTGDEIDWTYRVCFKSTVMGSQAAAMYMKDQGGGVIINISSLAARCATSGRATLYGPLKSAVNNFTNTFAGEVASMGIRVIAVMPGFTLTPALQAVLSDEAIAEQGRSCLLRRAATPDEMASPIVFLASPLSSYMTSTSVEISGGRFTTLNPEFSYQNNK